MFNLKALKKWYLALSQPVKASVWFIFCNFAQKATAMITTPIFTRMMSQEEFGVIGTFNSWKIMFDYILTFCFASCAMQLYIHTDEREKVLSALCGLELLVMSIWTILFTIFSDVISSLLGVSHLLTIGLAILILSNQSIEIWMSYERYAFRYRNVVIVTAIITIVSTIIAAINVVCVSPTAESRLLPLVIITAIVGMFLYLRIIGKYGVFYDKKIWSTAMVIGVPAVFTNLSHFVLASSDVLMIRKICGTKDVAIYSIAYSVSGIIAIISSAIGASFTPYAYQKIKQKDYKTLESRSNIVVLVVATFYVGIMLFGREIVLFMGGYKYIQSIDLIVPVCIGIFFNYLVTIYSKLLHYELKNFILMLTAIGCATSNIVLNAFFIPIFGYKAAAYTTAISYLMFLICHFIIYHHIVKIDFAGNTIVTDKKVFIITAFFILLGVAILFLEHYLVIKYLIVIFVAFLLLIKRKYVVHILREITRK